MNGVGRENSLQKAALIVAARKSPEEWKGIWITRKRSAFAGIWGNSLDA